MTPVHTAARPLSSCLTRVSFVLTAINSLEPTVNTTVKSEPKPLFGFRLWWSILTGVTNSWMELGKVKAQLHNKEVERVKAVQETAYIAKSVREYALKLHDSKKPAPVIQVELLKLLNDLHFTKPVED